MPIAPINLDIPGEDLPKVQRHYYKDPHYYALQKVVDGLGSSNSAIDVALEACRKGAEVTAGNTWRSKWSHRVK